LKKSGSRLALGCKVAATYVGMVVGAGFASGQEVLRFFTIYGSSSVWAICISTFFFIWAGTRTLAMGRKLGVQSFGGLIRHVFGSFSFLMNGFLMVAMMVIVSAMFAGAGALFEEHLGIPFWTGVGVTAVLVFATVFFRIKGLLWINLILVPIILLFSLSAFFYSLFQLGSSAVDLASCSASPFDLIKTGVFYASFNIILAIGVLASVGNEVRDARVLSFGGVLGGSFLGVMLMAINITLLLNKPAIYELEIPILYVVIHMGRTFFIVYAAAVWAAVFTTLAGCIYSISSTAEELFGTGEIPSSLGTIGLGVIFSSLGFSRIVNWFYPILGLIGFILIIWIFFNFNKKGD
jgi:uncharacterized membrane protein YkvI